jgi:dienelactone hydrolase
MFSSPFSRRQFLFISGAAALPFTSRAAQIPQTLDELWAGFDEMDRTTPLEVEVLKEWETDGVVCKVIRYVVGHFKGAPSRVAAFYAMPKGGSKLPAVVDIHGGGQSASLSVVMGFAKRGYAAISLNWGGNKMNINGEVWGGPQTDWGRLDATHPPQRNKTNHFVGALMPDEFTIDDVESPRNSNWYLVLLAARRAVTLLGQQPEVDGQRIGARGHSMGGKLTTNLAGIDRRIKAAVPSCGGSGIVLESETAMVGGRKTKEKPMELALIADNAYIPRIECPVLWLSPTNDFHAHIDNMAWNWRAIRDEIVRFSIAPHLNHRHTEEHAVTEMLWFEQHLKGAKFAMPATPKIALNLATPGGVPEVKVEPDSSRKVIGVDVYYSLDPHGLTRFWRDAQAAQDGNVWRAACAVMTLEQPIFVFANVRYETPPEMAQDREKSAVFAISSRVLSASQTHLKTAGVKPSDKPDRSIDDGARGWRDWYLLNWGHPPLWSATTRKLKDPKWRGPDGATLSFEIRCETDNQVVVTVNCNAWGAFEEGKPTVDYTAVKQLKGSRDWQTVTISLAELTSTNPKVTIPLANWRTVTELSISPSGETMVDGARVKSNGKPWRGPREIRNLRWNGGEYPSQITADAPLKSDAFQKNFNDAIKKSLEQEKLEGK